MNKLEKEIKKAVEQLTAGQKKLSKIEVKDGTR
jgi:hypothetical protein